MPFAAGQICESWSCLRSTPDVTARLGVSGRAVLEPYGARIENHVDTLRLVSYARLPMGWQEVATSGKVGEDGLPVLLIHAAKDDI